MNVTIDTGRKGIVICGPVASGKTTMAKAMAKQMGDCVQLHEDELFHRSALSNLKGTETLLIDDAELNPTRDNGIKMLCSCDFINVEERGSPEPRTVQADFRLIITTNRPVEKIDESLRRRFVIIVL